MREKKMDSLSSTRLKKKPKKPCCQHAMKSKRPSLQQWPLRMYCIDTEALVLSCADGMGSPTNHPGLQAATTHRARDPLLRQGEPGTSQYLSLTEAVLTA